MAKGIHTPTTTPIGGTKGGPGTYDGEKGYPGRTPGATGPPEKVRDAAVAGPGQPRTKYPGGK